MICSWGGCAGISGVCTLSRRRTVCLASHCRSTVAALSHCGAHSLSVVAKVRKFESSKLKVEARSHFVRARSGGRAVGRRSVGVGGGGALYFVCCVSFVGVCDDVARCLPVLRVVPCCAVLICFVVTLCFWLDTHDCVVECNLSSSLSSLLLSGAKCVHTWCCGLVRVLLFCRMWAACLLSGCDVVVRVLLLFCLGRERTNRWEVASSKEIDECSECEVTHTRFPWCYGSVPQLPGSRTH